MENKIRKIIAENMDLNIDEIFNESLLEKDLDFDSLDSLECAVNIEENFKIKIPDEDIEKWITVQCMIDTVKRIII